MALQSVCTIMAEFPAMFEKYRHFPRATDRHVRPLIRCSRERGAQEGLRSQPPASGRRRGAGAAAAVWRMLPPLPPSFTGRSSEHASRRAPKWSLLIEVSSPRSTFT